MKDKSDEKKHKGKSHHDGKEAAEAKPESPAAAGAVQGTGPQPKGPEPGNGPGAAEPAAGEKSAGPEEGQGTAGEGVAEGRDRLAAECEKLAREKLELEDKYLRLRADFENFRKRVNKEKANLIQYGNEALLRDLLPVIDNIQRALAHSLQEGDWQSFREGIELVLAELHKTLSAYGVVPVEALGKEFDPNVHEAVQRVAGDQPAPGIVVEEFLRGYLFRGMLLRPARVAVAVREEAKGGQAGAAGGDGVADGDGSPGQGGDGGTSEAGGKIIN
jgi:molecular chaperone GrpE